MISEGESAGSTIAPGAAEKIIGEPAEPNSSPLKLPIDWSGTGVLSASKGTSTPNAPDWSKNSQVEIILSEGIYYLRATSKAENINNISLLEQTAANRARALLQTTLKQHLLTQTRVVRTWKNPKKAEMIVQVQTPIPTEWAQVAPEPHSVKDSPL